MQCLLLQLWYCMPSSFLVQKKSLFHAIFCPSQGDVKWCLLLHTQSCVQQLNVWLWREVLSGHSCIFDYEEKSRVATKVCFDAPMRCWAAEVCCVRSRVWVGGSMYTTYIISTAYATFLSFIVILLPPSQGYSLLYLLHPLLCGFPLVSHCWQSISPSELRQIARTLSRQGQGVHWEWVTTASLPACRSPHTHSERCQVSQLMKQNIFYCK